MLIAAAILLLGAAQPAPSGADVACILDRVPAEARAVALDEAVGGEAGPARAALRAAARACARDHGWKQGREARSGDFAAVHMIMSEATARLESGGVPPRIVLEWFEAQGGVGSDSGRAVDGLLARLLASGVPRGQLEAQAETIGALVGALEGARVMGGRE